MADEDLVRSGRGGTASIVQGWTRACASKQPPVRSRQSLFSLVSPLTMADSPGAQTLVAYENLKRALPFPDPAGMISLLPQQEDLSRIRARNALKGAFESCRRDSTS